ncbi:MAG TPA: ATP-binding protein [Edaphobacter sp.]|nr:ATP-binding protein [Edaphobacter sp.]
MSTGSGFTSNGSIPTPPRSPTAHFHAHSVQFYEEDSFLLDSLTKVIGTTLVAGDVAIVIATQEHRDGLAKRLKARGLDLEVTAKLGRYCALDANETLSGFMLQGLPDPALFHSFMGYLFSAIKPTAEGTLPRTVHFGEMVALLFAEGNFEAALKLEQLWNDLARSYSFELHCAYPMKVFDQQGHTQAFHNICAEHNHVIPTEDYTALACEDDRLRHIALLQQQARTAESETARRLRAEEALRRSEKLAAAGRLAASIAHEINNPLEAISNAIYLARVCPPPETSQYLKLADDELARVAQITKQTLGFYRETATPGFVKLSALLDDLLSLFKRKLDAKNLSVKKQYRNELEIWGLEGELRQVFANQITNAIYALPKNGCLTVRIRTSKSWSNGQCPGTAVSLIDNGSGISQESLPKIFDPFFTTKQDDGNGLGLWITHDIVTRHSGSIRARSITHPGASGTIFTTFLPQHEDNVLLHS